jgi:hypothetical protein
MAASSLVRELYILGLKICLDISVKIDAITERSEYFVRKIGMALQSNAVNR